MSFGCEERIATLMIDLVNFVSNFFELGSHFAYRSFSAVEIYSQEVSQQSRSTHKGFAEQFSSGRRKQADLIYLERSTQKRLCRDV